MHGHRPKLLLLLHLCLCRHCYCSPIKPNTPRNGMRSQSGRLFSSYATSYSAFSRRNASSNTRLSSWLVPAIGPSPTVSKYAFRYRQSIALRARICELMKQRDIRRIMKGSHHTRYIAQSQRLLTSLGERPGRLTLKVNHHEVISGVQHLP